MTDHASRSEEFTRRTDFRTRMIIGREYAKCDEALAQYATDAEREAWIRGYRDGQITGQDSLEVITPYDVDTPLYEAWQAGYDAA